MSLTKETIIDKYEIVGEFKHIQCRHATIIKEDGIELSRSYHRHVISPGDDVTDEPQEVQDLVSVLHTPELIAAYQAQISNQEI